MTGGRVKRSQNLLKMKIFPYIRRWFGQCQFKKIIKFSFQNQALMTLTAVHPFARFGYEIKTISC